MVSESAAWRTAHRSSHFPDFILLRCIAECGLIGSNGQAHKLKIGFLRLVLHSKPCSCCIHIQQDGAWKGIGGGGGGGVIEMLVSVLQTR